MRRWAWVTVLLYASILAAASLPLAMSLAKPPEDAVRIYARLEFWIPLGILTLSQALLLVVPVRAARGRPISRRTLWIPLIVSGFLAALLVAGLVLSLVLAVFGDRDKRVDPIFVVSLVWAILGWIIWGIVFHRYSASGSAESFSARLVRNLLRGSILELLVAVPSHVITRNRDDCCAPFITMWGIATGLAVMLASFGPGVFFLFARRMRRLRREVGPEISG